jgi:hypothetical protein
MFVFHRDPEKSQIYGKLTPLCLIEWQQRHEETNASTTDATTDLVGRILHKHRLQHQQHLQHITEKKHK